MRLRYFHIAFLVIMVAVVSFAPLGGIAVGQEAGSTPEATPGRGLSDAPVQMLLRGEGQLDGERINLEVPAGETRGSIILIGNVGTDPLKVFAFTSNITTKVNGGMQLGSVDDELREPSSWMTFPTEEFEVESGKEVQKDFTVAVPDRTAPGQYVIPVAVETVDSFSMEGNSMIRQKVRKVMTIYITVPGDYTTSFEYGEPYMEYVDRGLPAIIVPISNTGKTTLRLSGTIRLLNSSGSAVIEAPLQLGTIYGGHETIIRSWVPPTLPIGDYRLSISLTDSDTGVANQFEDAVVTMPAPPEQQELVPLEFESVMILPNAEPIQFASIVIEIANNAETQQSTKLTLIVSKDGQPLEEFVLAENVVLQQGVTTVSQRYLPLTGWESGSYSFSLRLESVDSSGGVSLLLSSENVATVDVP